MSNIERNAETLSSFGMTVKQAKIYLTLVSLGIAQVGDISKHSKVRREEVYRILPKLEKMGLIEKTLSIPVTLKAAPVENALSILIRIEEEKAKNRLDELVAKKEEFLSHHLTSMKENKSNGEQFALISEKTASLGKMTSLIEGANKEIICCISREKLFQFLKFSSEILAEATERGVKIRIISKSIEGEDKIANEIKRVIPNRKTVMLRYVESLPNHFMVIDNAEVFIATSTEGYLAEHPLLWSNNQSQIMVYRKLFEDLWTSSVENVALDTDNEIERLKRFIQQMKPSDHSILLYETSEAKLKVLLNFISYTLENNEAAVYVCSEASVEEIKASMQLFGIEVKKYEQAGALKVLDYTQHYIIDGQFDSGRTKTLWDTYLKDALHRGFKNLRVIGETACFFKHNLVKELLDYEKSLHKTFDNQMIAICAYRADMLMAATSPVNLYAELVKAHGNVVFAWADSEMGRIAIS